MSSNGVYFDGETSAGRPSKVRAESDGSLCIEFNGTELKFKDYSVSPPVGRTALRVRFKDGGLLELPHDSPLLASLQGRASIIHRTAGKLERKLHFSLATVAAAIVVCAMIYLYGLPLLGKGLAPLVPMSVKGEFGRQAMIVLDRLMLSPSQLGSGRHRELEAIMSKLLPKANLDVTPRLLLRRFSKDDNDIANAFALLPNTIIVTDTLAGDLSNEEIRGVLAHELGHLAKDHGTQMLVRGSLLSLLSLAIFGGDPGIIHTLAISLIESTHSRAQENEADAYAVELLKRSGDDPKSLARALKRLSEGHKESAIEGYISSHPVTSERIKRIEDAS